MNDGAGEAEALDLALADRGGSVALVGEELGVIAVERRRSTRKTSASLPVFSRPSTSSVVPPAVSHAGAARSGSCWSTDPPGDAMRSGCGTRTARTARDQPTWALRSAGGAVGVVDGCDHLCRPSFGLAPASTPDAWRQHPTHGPRTEGAPASLQPEARRRHQPRQGRSAGEAGQRVARRVNIVPHTPLGSGVVRGSVDWAPCVFPA